MVWRRVAGVVVGLIAGIIAVALIEGISSVLYPPPQDLNFHDPQALRDFVSTLPLGAFLLVILAHGVGAFGAGFTCAAIVRVPWVAGSIILGSLLLLGGIGNLVMIPHPLWFAIVDIAVYLPAALIGGRLAHTLFGVPTPVAADEAPPE